MFCRKQKEAKTQKCLGNVSYFPLVLWRQYSCDPPAGSLLILISVG